MARLCACRLWLAGGLLVPTLSFHSLLWAQETVEDSASTTYTISAPLIEAFPVDRPVDALTFQPGVTITNQGEVLLRGGKPGDVTLYLDGIPILSGFRSRPFFGLSRSQVLESRIGVPPISVQSISAVIGPLPTPISNGQSGAILIHTRDGGGRISGALGFESDEPFGPGSGVGLNRLEGSVSGAITPQLSFFASGLLQGQESVGSGFDADAAPIFVQRGIDTTVAVPSVFGDLFVDTTFVDVQRYQASSDRPPLSMVSVYQVLGKLTYEFGSDSRVSLLGIKGQNQNRNFEYGTLYNAAGVTGSRSSSSLLAVTWQQRLGGAEERSLVLSANLSFHSDREGSGPLSLDEERNTADPFEGFLVRPLDLRFDFDNFPVDEELLENYRTNRVGSRRSPYELENVAQYVSRRPVPQQCLRSVQSRFCRPCDFPRVRWPGRTAHLV